MRNLSSNRKLSSRLSHEGIESSCLSGSSGLLRSKRVEVEVNGAARAGRPGPSRLNRLSEPLSVPKGMLGSVATDSGVCLPRVLALLNACSWNAGECRFLRICCRCCADHRRDLAGDNWSDACLLAVRTDWKAVRRLMKRARARSDAELFGDLPPVSRSGQAPRAALAFHRAGTYVSRRWVCQSMALRLKKAASRKGR